MERSERKRRAGRCSIRDLAEYVGLSTCTVSKVLNGRAGRKIPAATQERVLAAARELDYVPNVNAQRLFRHKAGVLGLLVPSRTEAHGNVFDDTHFVDILGGMEEALSRNGYHLLLLFDRDPQGDPNRYWQLFRAGTIDGLLIWGAHRTANYWPALRDNGAPALFLTSCPDTAPGDRIHYVVSDYRTTARQLTARLLEIGCRRLLYLAGPEESSVVTLFSEGIAEALRHSDSVCVTRHCNYSCEEAAELTEKLLRESSFDAVLATSKHIGAGVRRTIAESGRQGIFLVVLDNDAHPVAAEDCFGIGIPDDRRIGAAAIEGIAGLIDGSVESVQMVIPSRIVWAEKLQGAFAR